MRVSLISNAPTGGLGSMGIYGELVAAALRAYAPHIDAKPVLLPSLSSAHGGRSAQRFALLEAIVRSRAVCRNLRADAHHVLDGSFGYMVKGLHPEKTLVTVHDLIPALQVQGRFPVAAPGWAATKLINSSLGWVREAGAVHAVSRRTADDIHELTGRHVDAVVPNPVRAFPGLAALTLARQPNVLHVGNNGFYKNRQGALDIFAVMARARESLTMVMAGPEPHESLVNHVAELGLASRVRWVIDPTDHALTELYLSSSVLLFPSWYEGFGWPPLEAMQHRCPVVCSDAGSLPEVVGPAALTCSPADVEGFAHQALRILDDDELRQALVTRGLERAAGFTLKRLADGLVPLYERLSRA